jgi:thiol:disulfide interchange protein
VTAGNAPLQAKIESVQRFPALQRTELGHDSGDVIVHCWAEWNTYDSTCAERLAEAAQTRGVLHLCRSHNVNDPTWWEDLRRWGVVNIPAIVFFRNGGRLETVIGLRPVEHLEAALSRWTDTV